MNEKVIEKVRTSALALDIENNYRNVAFFSGWIIEQPRIIEHDKTGRESASFIIAQFNRDCNGRAYMKTFHLMTYVHTIVDQIKAMKRISFIVCGCQIQHNGKSGRMYPQVYNMKVQRELPIKLEPESED